MANENLKNGPVNPDAENDEEMTVTLTLDDGTEIVHSEMHPAQSWSAWC